jgi:hypothetical protein
MATHTMATSVLACHNSNNQLTALPPLKGLLHSSDHKERVWEHFYSFLTCDRFYCRCLFFPVFTAVPREIKKKLSKGLPAQWKMMVKTWASLLPPVEK